MLLDLLLNAARDRPDGVLRCLGGRTRTFAELRDDALRVAAAAVDAGVEPGTMVVLVIHDMSDFFPAFWGVLAAGGVPVPLAGVRSASPEEQRRVQRVVRKVGGPVVTDRGIRVPGWPTHDIGDWLAAAPLAAPRPYPGLGMIQFSSGSTRDPAGVMLSQDALLANCRQMTSRLSTTADDRYLSWAPHFHDMGLIGSHLMPLSAGADQVRMEAMEVIRDPLSWLRNLSEHRSTLASTTNFAVARIADAVSRQGLPEGLDLSALRLLNNGGEPISAAVCRRFSRLTGIPESVHHPAYGMAESCVGLAARDRGGLVTREVDGRELVVIGPPLDGVELRILDREGQPLPDGEIGEIAFRGPNAFDGYLGEEPLGEWVHTGDLGILEAGELTVVGRRKELIIVNARNLHPHDVEQVAEAVDGVRTGGAVAVADEHGDHEVLSLLVKIDPDREAVSVLRAVRRAVAAEVGVVPHRVWPLEKVPRTTSGKKRRSWLTKQLHEGALDETVHQGTVEAVRRLWSAELDRELGPAELDTDFRELGGASLQAVELVGRVEQAFEVAPDLRLLTEGATVRRMARLLERQVGAERSEERVRGVGAVAIVDLAVRLPGSEDLDSLAVDGPTRIRSTDRFDRPLVGGFLDADQARAADFDPARFGIDPAEAAVMDPQQRLILQLATELLPRLEGDRSVGVFVGAGHQSWMEGLLPRLDEDLPPGTMAANLLNLIAARVSHHHDLHGPALTVDTACSSGLVALHLALRALQAGECRFALAGAVNLLLSPTAHRLFEVAGALSPSGRCTPFAGGDGMVPGEGGGLVLLAPLSEARARGWPVVGVIRGSAINNDGSSLGVMAPNPAGQEAVIRQALDAAGIPAERVARVEAHGTGTPVGDSVEDAVLRRVYPHDPPRGAVKARIGHLLSAAGLAGLVHLLAHLEPGAIGAVSSFGFGGTNAHLLVEGGADRPVREGPSPLPPVDDWVHTVRTDLAGGLVWTPVPAGPSPLTERVTVAITGGSGAVGRALTEHLRQRYDARVTWIGRTEPDALPEGVRFLAADLSDRSQAVRAAEALGPVDLLLHLAGGLSDAALRAKRLGAGVLGEQASRVVLYSSISGTLPGLDQGIEDYAAANAALDQQAREARANGRPWTSIVWPPFTGGGLAAGRTGALENAGIRPIGPDRAFAALERALASEEPVVVVLDRPEVAAEPLPDDLGDWLRERVAAEAELHPRQIGLDDPLPSLGLDSMAALDLVRELEAKLGRKLPTTLAYEGGSIAGILAILERGGVREAPEAAVPTLLPSQQTFVVQSRFFPDIPGNTLVKVEVEPALDRAALERALEALVARHPAVRSAIRKEEGQWARVEGALPELRWQPSVDLDAVHNEPFDLERGPVLRVVTDGHTLVLDGHHALLDAWSQRNLLEDLLALHALAEAGEPVALPPLRTSLDEAVAAVGAGSDGGDPGWWEQRFADPLPPLALPWEAPLDEPVAPPCLAIPVDVGPERTAALEDRARDLGLTLPAVVLAAWAHALWACSGTGDLAIRVAQGRREARLPDLDRVVGSFADSLPVRIGVSPSGTVADLAKRVADELVEVRSRAGASAMGLARLGERGGAGPVGLTPAGFSFPLLPAATELAGRQLSDVFGASASGFSRVGLIAWRYQGRLQASLNALESHLSRPTCDRLIARFQAALDAFVADASRAGTLHGRILAHAAATPERLAVGSLSYGALARRSAALSATLDGPRIAVLARPSEEAVVALLAVLRTGAAYVPLDPGWPDGRIATVLEVSRPTAVIAPPELAERAASFDLPVHRITDEEADGGPLREGDLAYVMFTSGTTGRPKGAMLSHAASLCFVDWCIAAFGLGPTDRLAWTSSLGFGGSIRQVFATLVAGGTAVPVPDGLTRDPDGLVGFLHDEGITVWNSVPSLWTHLVSAMERTGRGDPLPAVRWVLLGGEAVPAAHVRRWRATFGDRIRLANVYGSTETAHNATWFEVRADPDGAHTPIGWDRAGVRCHLVDVEEGVGEIVVSGGIADGYLHDPERTAEAFVELPGLGRVYRTGDLARRRADGALVYLGRRDAQVQVRGNRVELGEIEFTLCEHPAVRHALCTQRPDGRLHAAVEGETTAEALRDWLSERLPGFMVPHTWEIADQLPRTAAGKRDRRALAASVAAEPPPPAGPLLAQLAAAWVAVLGLAEAPGPTDDFFALGGDSLTLLEVVDHMRDRVAVDSPLPLYRHATLAKMAAYLESRVDQAPRSAPVAEREKASVVERGFWMAQQADPEHPPLWTASVPLRGPLDLAAFRAALETVVARHGMLRATWDAGGVRTIAERPAPLLQLDDLSALPPALREPALATRLAEARALRLPMDRWAPWQVRLVRMGSEDHRLILAVHHAVADGWSAWLLTRELLVLHDALARGARAQLPDPAPFRPPPPPAPDPWWAQALAGLTQTPAPERDRDHQAEVSLDPGRWHRIQRRAAAEGVSPFALVAAAVAGALKRSLDTDDVVLSTALAGRPPEAGESVGPYARALPVRIRGAADPRSVADALAQAADHADAPPWQIVTAAGSDGAARLGRFFLTWLDPSAVPAAPGPLQPDWAAGDYRFATRSTDTEVLVGALVQDGLRIHLHGGARVRAVAELLEGALRQWTRSQAALVVYAPPGTPLPVSQPVVGELVDADLATSELVLLPRTADQLRSGEDLDRAVSEAMAVSEAPVVALAGMLPALTGLGSRALGRPDQRLTTGHGATVVAMVLTLERVLAETGRDWASLRVGYLGYGAVGQAVHALATERLGPPASTSIRDPRHPDTVDRLDVDLVVGATSGGKALEVTELAPGTIVVDDSFPRCFDDDEARARMERARDVLLVGGGTLDAGTLHRWSPFAQAAALRSRFVSRWLPGCHAEAVLLAADPALGPSVGVVDVDRARAVLAAVQAAGWTVPPLHLGNWIVPEPVLEGVRR